MIIVYTTSCRLLFNSMYLKAIHSHLLVRPQILQKSLTYWLMKVMDWTLQIQQSWGFQHRTMDYCKNIYIKISISHKIILPPFYLIRVIVAISFNTSAGKDYTQSSSEIVETLYGHLDQLGEYFHVTDMRTGNNIIAYTESSCSS